MPVFIHVEVNAEEALAYLSRVQEAIPEAIDNEMHSIGEDAKEVMDEHTHVRTGRLQEGNVLETSYMAFMLSNAVFYAKFIEYGHMTPHGWHTARGFRMAHRRSHVGPFPFLEPAYEFIEENITDRLVGAISGAIG